MTNENSDMETYITIFKVKAKLEETNMLKLGRIYYFYLRILKEQTHGSPGPVAKTF